MRQRVGGGLGIGAGVAGGIAGIAVIATGPVGWAVSLGIASAVAGVGGGGFKLGNWLLNKQKEDKISSLDKKQLDKITERVEEICLVLRKSTIAELVLVKVCSKYFESAKELKFKNKE